ncbi:MAG: ABC transporter ATP-binding protein, partial [Myxococcota bacterium]
MRKLKEVAPMEALSFRSCQSQSPWQRLWAWISFERQDLWVAAAYAAAVGVFSLATPLAVQSLFNTVAFGTLFQPLLVLAIILFIALGVSAFLNALQLLIVEHIGRRVFLRTAMDFAARLPLVRSRLGDRDLDELSNRFIDVVIVEKTMSKIVFDGLSATLQISVGLLLLGVYHPYLLAFDIILVASVLFVIFVLGRKAVSTAIVESKKKYALFAWLQDIAKNTLAFRSERGGDYATKRTTQMAEDWLGSRKRHFGIQFRQVTGMYTIQVVATTLLLALGGFLVVERQLSLGQLVAAELMIALTVSSLAKISTLFSQVYDLIAALDKIGAVLDLEAPDVEGEDLGGGGQGLALQINMSALSLQLAAGEKRLVCATERPESLNVIDGLISPSTQPRGAIRIDRIDARDVAVDSLHESVMLLRPGSLFPGTVRDNL